MKFWNFDQHPYRPVERDQRLQHTMQRPDLQPDVFFDAAGRVWYAATRELKEALPADPLAVQAIPPQFWHPDVAHPLRKHIDHHDRVAR